MYSKMGHDKKSLSSLISSFWPILKFHHMTFNKNRSNSAIKILNVPLALLFYGHIFNDLLSAFLKEKSSVCSVTFLNLFSEVV